MGKTARRIVRFLSRNPKWTQIDLCAALNRKISTVSEHTSRLVRLGILSKKGSNKDNQKIWVVEKPQSIINP